MLISPAVAPVNRGAMAAQRTRGFAGPMFTMADVKKGRRVTLQEATALSLQHFKSADANRDGTVTHEKRRQMRQQRRGAAPGG